LFCACRCSAGVVLSGVEWGGGGGGGGVFFGWGGGGGGGGGAKSTIKTGHQLFSILYSIRRMLSVTATP
jgi:hypothetical protein